MNKVTPTIMKRIKNEVSLVRKEMLVPRGHSSEEKAFQAIHNYWLDSKLMDENIVESINSMKNTLNMPGATHALSLRLRLPKELVTQIVSETGAVYYTELAKASLAKTILQLLLERDQLIVEWREGKIKSSTGRDVITLVPWFEFEEKEKLLVEKDTKLPYGLYFEPGVVNAKYIRTHPWEPVIKLNSRQKEVKRQMGSFGVRLIQQSREWWDTYFHSRPDYLEAVKMDFKQEDEILFEIRIQKYIDVIMDISTHDRLYMSWWEDARGRSYPDLTFAGIKLHGDSVEKHIWEASTPWKVNYEAHIKCKIACAFIAMGKNTDAVCLKRWNKHEAEIRDTLLNDSNIGNVMYHESLLEIIDTPVGETTHKFIGEDLSTNGLGIFGSNFRYIRPMKLANIGGLKTVQDAHGTMAKCFKEDRKIIKDNVSTALLHGSGCKAISLQLSKMGTPYSPKEVRTFLVDSFGYEILLINRIATWGRNLYNNKVTSLKMTSPEGYKYLSQAYTTKNILNVQGLSFKNKNYRSKVQIICPMPILFSNDGKKVLNTLDKKGEVKMSGYHANVTHMLDGFMLRTVILEANAPVLTVHDNFFTEPNKLHNVSKAIIKCHELFYDHNYYEKTMRVSAKFHPRKDILLPHFEIGKAKKDVIAKSRYFLQQ